MFSFEVELHLNAHYRLFSQDRIKYGTVYTETERIPRKSQINYEIKSPKTRNIFLRNTELKYGTVYGTGRRLLHIRFLLKYISKKWTKTLRLKHTSMEWVKLKSRI